MMMIMTNQVTCRQDNICMIAEHVGCNDCTQVTSKVEGDRSRARIQHPVYSLPPTARRVPASRVLHLMVNQRPLRGAGELRGGAGELRGGAGELRGGAGEHEQRGHPDAGFHVGIYF